MGLFAREDAKTVDGLDFMLPPLNGSLRLRRGVKSPIAAVQRTNTRPLAVELATPGAERDTETVVKEGWPYAWPPAGALTLSVPDEPPTTPADWVPSPQSISAVKSDTTALGLESRNVAITPVTAMSTVALVSNSLGLLSTSPPGGGGPGGGGGGATTAKAGPAHEIPPSCISILTLVAAW